MTRGGLLAILLASAACGGDAPARFLGVTEVRPTGSTAIAEDGLVMAFDMETILPDGTLRDVGPHGLHGAILRSRPEPGPTSTARRFETVEDRVDLPEQDALALDGPITVATWVKITRGGLHQHIVACDDKFVLWIPPEDRLRFVDTLGHGRQTTTPIEVDRWYSVVAILDATRGDEITPRSLRIFVDGKVAETEPVNRAAEPVLRWAPGPLYPDDACHIGFESHQGDAEHQQLPFVGAIDDLAVYRRVWTDTEAAAHARRRPHGTTGPGQP